MEILSHLLCKLYILAVLAKVRVKSRVYQRDTLSVSTSRILIVTTMALILLLRPDGTAQKSQTIQGLFSEALITFIIWRREFYWELNHS